MPKNDTKNMPIGSANGKHATHNGNETIPVHIESTSNDAPPKPPSQYNPKIIYHLTMFSYYLFINLTTFRRILFLLDFRMHYLMHDMMKVIISINNIKPILTRNGDSTHHHDHDATGATPINFKAINSMPMIETNP